MKGSAALGLVVGDIYAFAAYASDHMNHRSTLRCVLWLTTATVIACKESPKNAAVVPPAPTPPMVADALTLPPQPGNVDNAGSGSGSAPVVHGEKWQDGDTPGSGFTAFKETWIYVDGEPVATMLVPELPAIPVAWTAKEEDLDFVLGVTPKKIRKYYVRRWRLAEYLAAVGIPLNKIKMVYLQGGAGVIEVPGDVLRKFADGIRFDLTGMDKTKSRFFFPPDMPHFGQFDRYAAVSVLIDKPLLVLDVHKNLLQDGVEVQGIPYHGNPERGGIRIYRDGRLALVIKRNTLGDAGRIKPTEARWAFDAVLKANGASTAEVAAADIVYKGARKRVAGDMFKNLEFATNSQASGEILIGKDALPANAILLYSKNRVPKAAPEPPEEIETLPKLPK
jgi:hypothetical protein